MRKTSKYNWSMQTIVLTANSKISSLWQVSRDKGETKLKLNKQERSSVRRSYFRFDGVTRCRSLMAASRRWIDRQWRLEDLSPVHTSNNVEATGNIVEATFDFVEATFDTVERIVQLVAFDNVASTLLLVWTGLNVWRLTTSSAQRFHRVARHTAIPFGTAGSTLHSSTVPVNRQLVAPTSAEKMVDSLNRPCRTPSPM